jgi:hypothetical protein
MSEMGHFQTFGEDNPMSAYPPKADIVATYFKSVRTGGGLTETFKPKCLVRAPILWLILPPQFVAKTSGLGGIDSHEPQPS